MKKASLLKISFAMTVISLYTYVFGVMEIVGGVGNTNNSTSLNGGDIIESGAVSTLDLSNEAIPQTADYIFPTVPSIKEPRTYIESVALNRQKSTAFDEISTGTATTSTAGEPASTTSATTATTKSAASTATAKPATSAATQKSTETEPPPEVTTARIPSATNAPKNPETNLSENETEPAESLETLKLYSGGILHEGDAFDIVSRIVQTEVGSSFHVEAIKAQAVAAYTYIKRHNLDGTPPSMHLASSASEKVKECLREVWGQGIYYNGNLIQSVFSASSAGYSASSQNVWVEALPYLQSVDCSFDLQYDPNMGRTVSFKSSEIAAKVLNQTGIQLSGEPEHWLAILSHTDNVYVGNMSIGGNTSYSNGSRTVNITGRHFREKIMGYALRSGAFSFVYDSDNDSFVFTTNGYGHGAGMSQNGANTLATHYGYNYVDILKHYYSGVEVYYTT